MRGILLLFCLPIFWLTHVSHERLMEKLPFKDDANASVALPPAEFLQLTSLGHDALAADMLWLQLIQYYGATVQQKQPASYLFQYFDTLTTLAPHFETAYVFSGFLMPEEPEQVMTLLKKGMQNNPQSVDIFFQAGFIAYLQLKDNKLAAQYFQEASQLPGAPAIASKLAADLYAKTDKQSLCAVSLSLLERAVQQAPDDISKERSMRQFVERRSLCELRVLNQKVQQYARLAEQHYQAPEVKDGEKAPSKPSFLPPNLAELTKAGLMPGQISKNAEGYPQDALGRPFVYQKGQVKIRPFAWGVKFEDELKAYLAS